MIGRTISHYEILEQIGDGGMGTVYKALDTKLQVHRALKFIHPHLVTDPDFKHRFIQEAQAASSLDHPNICGIHQVDETDSGRPFICMTYYEGVTLSERLKEAPLPAREVFQIGLAIASGLMCAHRNGIVHRDIKPGNIMITGDGYTKILDFGLAKLQGVAGLTKTGVTMGTVRYMSPEQATGEKADHRSDIWALGLLMYEMATGEFPFQGDFDPAIIYSILNTQITPVHEVNPDIPEAQSMVIARCLEKDPAKRYQEISELINDMGGAAKAEGWESSFGDLMVPTSHTGFGAVSARRRTWRRGLLAAGFLAAAVAGLIWWTSRPPALYTTDLRLAVMPLENKAHPAQDLAVDGLSEVVCQMLDDTSRSHDSMWVVPYSRMLYSNLAEDAQARQAFGVNRIVTGGLQLFEGGQALFLTLRDAESLEQIRTVRVPFNLQSSVMSDSLPGAIMRLIDHDPKAVADFPTFLPSSDPAAGHYLQGLGAMQAKDYSAAMESLVQATSAAPGFAPGWSVLGWAKWMEYRRTGAEELVGDAAADLEQAVVLAPGMWRPGFRLGEFYRKTGSSDEAQEAFLAANENDPGNPLICRGLSRVYRGMQRFAEAEALLRISIERRPDYFETHRMLALYYYRMGETEACLGQLDQTLALAPGDAPTLNTKGAVLVARGEYTRAREQFERAFALIPNCDTCANIGFTLYHEEKFKESASYYELSMEYCEKEDRQVWANWARALYWADGGRPQSIAKFQEAIDLAWEELSQSPGDPLIIGALIEYHAMIGDEESTRRLIATGDSVATDNPELLYLIGDAYELIGDRNAALRYLTNAVRHGVPVERILGTRELVDLAADPRFARMISAESGTMEAPADNSQ